MRFFSHIIIQMQQDPFFQAKNKQTTSGALGYYEDLFQTYKGLPKRTNEYYTKASNYRDIEKSRIDAVVEENEFMRSQIGKAVNLIKSQRDAMRTLNSKLLSNTQDVSSKSGSDRGSKSVRIHEHEKPDRGESEAGDVRVPGDVLPSVLPDTGGPGVGDEPQGRPDSVGSEDGGSGLPGVRDSQIDEQHGSEGGVRDH